jgi:hypothetical protein
MALQPFIGHSSLFQFHNLFTQTIGLLGRVMSHYQRHYLHTEQYKHRIDAHTDIHALSEIRAHDLVSEDNSCLGPRGHCDRLRWPLECVNQWDSYSYLQFRDISVQLIQLSIQIPCLVNNIKNVLQWNVAVKWLVLFTCFIFMMARLRIFFIRISRSQYWGFLWVSSVSVGKFWYRSSTLN